MSTANFGVGPHQGECHLELEALSRPDFLVAPRTSCMQVLAEEEGFEPPEPLRAQRFSRPPHSTTLPLLRSVRCLKERAAKCKPRRRSSGKSMLKDACRTFGSV